MDNQVTSGIYECLEIFLTDNTFHIYLFQATEVSSPDDKYDKVKTIC